jgi:hypothetical protein
VAAGESDDLGVHQGLSGFRDPGEAGGEVHRAPSSESMHVIGRIGSPRCTASRRSGLGTPAGPGVHERQDPDELGVRVLLVD